MSEKEITSSELDDLVYKTLPSDHYIPFADLTSRLPVLAPEVRASLLRLQAEGLADLVYGRGWRKIRKLV